MAVTTINNGLSQEKGVNYTVITDSSADWASVANDTYFYDKTDGLPHYKDGSCNVLEVFASGGISDGDKGDITVSSSGTTWTIDNGVITNDKLANMPQYTIKGSLTGVGSPINLTDGQVRSILNVEDGADVTDSTNVEAAGAVMETDTSTSNMQFVVDEDNMVSDSPTKVPTQQSVKAYVDANSGGASELNDLTDVNTGLPVSPTNADDGKLLFYDHAAGEFITDDAVTHGTSVINCKKSTAGTIAKGLPVYLVGFDADLHTVELADATSSATMPVIGFTAEALDNTNSKHVTTFGKLTGIDTTSTVSTLNPNGETWAVNDALYMSTTAGGLTKVRPTGGTTEIQRIAKVLKVDATGGQIFVFNTARTAGLPNLGTDKLWIGSANGIPQEVDKSTLGGTPALNNGEIFVGDATNSAQSVPMSGDVNIDNTGLTTIQPDSVTYDKMQDVSQAALLGNENALGGTVTEIPIVDQYLPGGTITALLENTANWDINGNYIGTGITGTFQGQSHYDGNYWFTAVADNVWIRLIRG